jgi:hypothetical protein
MSEAKWGVYAPQATNNYERAASLARLQARIGPLHVEKQKKKTRLGLTEAVIFCLIAVGAFHAVKAGEIAFWTGYEAQAMRGSDGH